MSDAGSPIPGVSRARERVHTALTRRVGIDARALAAFRLVLGSLLLFDVLHRSQYLETFYTDGGVLPRSLLVEQYAPGKYSIHALSGEPWLQVVLFGCAAVSATALLVGYRTRIATVCSVVLLFSVHFRNPFVLNGADRLLRELLLLGVFLPLGNRWAIDTLDESSGYSDLERDDESAVRSGSDVRITTPATAAILVHVVVMFVNNAVLKATGDTWHSGEALGYALRLDHLTILLGDAVVNYPLVLTTGTYVWTGLVTGAPLLLLLAGRLRIAYVSAFIAAVTGLALSMAVGLFPVVLAGAFLLFLPPRVWDTLEHIISIAVDRVGVLERGRAAIRGAASRMGRSSTGGSVSSLSFSLSPPTRRRARQCWSLVLVCVLAIVVLWSGVLLGEAHAIEPVDSTVPDDYQWTMFAPNPSSSYGWYVVAGHVDGGEDIDVLRGATLRTDRPPDASDAFPGFRWRKYLNSLFDSDVRAERFATAMCEHSTAHADTSITNVTVTYTEQPIALEGATPPPETVTVVEQSCSRDRNAELQTTATSK
ncbi:hypothetical protein [Natrinema sp. HArc-T2]|uniref:hypothetical protein n=1 Tax=Natrinema sp. HArc-T2 TaxID=3242701 RepID=UPI00359D8B30